MQPSFNPGLILGLGYSQFMWEDFHSLADLDMIVYVRFFFYANGVVGNCE